MLWYSKACFRVPKHALEYQSMAHPSNQTSSVFVKRTSKSLSHMGSYVQYGNGLTVAHLPRFSTPTRVPNWQFYPLWDSHLEAGVLHGCLRMAGRSPSTPG